MLWVQLECEVEVNEEYSVSSYNCLIKTKYYIRYVAINIYTLCYVLTRNLRIIYHSLLVNISFWYRFSLPFVTKDMALQFGQDEIPFQNQLGTNAFTGSHSSSEGHNFTNSHFITILEEKKRI